MSLVENKQLNGRTDSRELDERDVTGIPRVPQTLNSVPSINASTSEKTYEEYEQ